MSYEILYDTQFIRSESGITPVILSGSNNCTEVNWSAGRRYERRERSWWVLFNRVGVSEDDFMENIQKMTGWAYQEHWKSHGKWVDDAALLRWAKNSIKRAATIESIFLHNRHHGSVQCYVSVWENGENRTALDRYIHSTEEFDEWIRDVNRLQTTLQPKSSAYPIVTFWEGMNHPSPKTFAPDERVVLKRKNEFLTEYSAGHSFWSPYAKEALVMTYRQTEEILKNRDIPGIDGAKVYRAKADDSSKYVHIKVTEQQTGCTSYYKRARRYSIMTTAYPQYAKCFLPVNAKQAVKRMQSKYTKLTFELVPVEESDS